MCWSALQCKCRHVSVTLYICTFCNTCCHSKDCVLQFHTIFCGVRAVLKIPPTPPSPSFQAHDCAVRSMTWSHQGTDWMVTTDDKGYVKYWQSNMNNVHTFQAHSEPVRCSRWGSCTAMCSHYFVTVGTCSVYDDCISNKGTPDTGSESFIFLVLLFAVPGS